MIFIIVGKSGKNLRNIYLTLLEAKMSFMHWKGLMELEKMLLKRNPE